MMDRALGAIATGTEAATSDAEAIKRFGMLYQWGRKDPFTPATTANTPNWNSPAAEVQIYKADGTAITKGVVSAETISEQFKYEARTTTNQTTINDLIQNPSTYYVNGDRANYVPIASTTDLTKDWWNPTIKTIYDPCPNGYRIPENETYGIGTYVDKLPDWSEWYEGGLKSGRVFKGMSFIPASGYRHSDTGQINHTESWGCNWMSTPFNITRGYRMYIIPSALYPNHAFPRAYGFPTRCIKE